MLAPNIAFRDVAFRLFSEASDAWLAYVGGDVELRNWLPLRWGRVAETIAVYDDEVRSYQVVFCWVGKQLKRNRLQKKWLRRFADLQCRYARNTRGDRYPQLSATVVVGQDEHSVRAAMELMPRVGSLGEVAFSFWVAESPCRRLAEYGAAIPNADFVFDRFEVPHLGQPENIAPPAGAGARDDPPVPAALSSVLGYKIACLAEKFSAITKDDCVELFNEFRGPVSDAFDQLVTEELFEERGATPEAVKAGLIPPGKSVYYMTEGLMDIAACRDRISLKTVKDREASYLNPDGQRHGQQLMHNRCVMLVKRILHKHGITLFGGWRRVVHLNGETQLQPDGFIYAHGPFGRGIYIVEIELTAMTPYQINRKWRT